MTPEEMGLLGGVILLFILSELVGLSAMGYNGVFEFVYGEGRARLSCNVRVILT
jgi:hypothetical protein